MHCSAGVGRTGCVIAIDQAMDDLDMLRPVDMNALVRRLRKDRYNLVQRVAQYVGPFTRSCNRAYLAI